MRFDPFFNIITMNSELFDKKIYIFKNINYLVNFIINN